MEKKHIAVLSSGYYPIMGAPSAVIDKYVKALRHDYSFHIITKTYETDFLPSDMYDIRYISNYRFELSKRCKKEINNRNHVLRNTFLLYVIKLYKLIQIQFSSIFEWEIKEYYRELIKLNKEAPLTAVIAVSNTYVTQLAMLKLKNNHKNIKWISFVFDPYAENSIYYDYKLFKDFWKKRYLKKEQKIYNTVDYSLFSVEMYKYVLNTFRIDVNKVFQIHYSLNKHLEGSVTTPNNKICRLVYAGMVYRDIRNPEYALSILSRIQNISVDLYVGGDNCDDIICKYLTKKIHRMNLVNRDVYENLIKKEYDILVSIGNRSILQSPSKMLELLSTGKPILNFYYVEDSQYEMIEKYPLGINIKIGDYGGVERVSDFCSKMKGKVLAFAEVEKLYPLNNLQRQVDLLRGLIEA